MNKSVAAARLAASWLLAYPDDALLARLDEISLVVDELPMELGEPLATFITHLRDSDLLQVQEHFVATFDMRRRACPYLTYWTAGDTRNRGMAILRFKQAYMEAGFTLGNEEMGDHLAVVLEFAAIGDQLTGDAFLTEYAGPIRLLRDALESFESPYSHVLDAIVATLPALTPEISRRMQELAVQGPPVEQVGLEPFGVTSSVDLIGARR